MGKLNEGDVIEGIFTIGLSLYIAHDKVEKHKLNKIRTEVDPQMFNTGRFTYTVAENLPKQNGSKPTDTFTVRFELRLKTATTAEAFGDHYQLLYKSSKDIGNLDKKIDQFINSINYGNYARRIKQVTSKFLDNNKGERVMFTVIGDGIEGEQTGGEIKGDVRLEVWAEVNNKKQRIDAGTIPFSLKSENKTVASLSPYHGMLNMAKALGIKWDGEKKYARLAGMFRTDAEKKEKFIMIRAMYNDLKNHIVSASSGATFSNNAYSFLEKNLFGTDFADVIDIQKGNVKEVTHNKFKTMSTKSKLYVKTGGDGGNNLVFHDKENQKPMFQIRAKLREQANEAKFYLEIGKGLYD
jgi:hypothetical protein